MDLFLAHRVLEMSSYITTIY